MRSRVAKSGETGVGREAHPDDAPMGDACVESEIEARLIGMWRMNGSTATICMRGDSLPLLARFGSGAARRKRGLGGRPAS